MSNQITMQKLVYPEYQLLWEAFMEALDQAQLGKGRDRHAQELEYFGSQKICEINRRLGSVDGCLFQAVKKIYEMKRLSTEAGLHELYGALVYVGAAIILQKEARMRELNDQTEDSAKKFLSPFEDQYKRGIYRGLTVENQMSVAGNRSDQSPKKDSDPSEF